MRWLKITAIVCALFAVVIGVSLWRFTHSPLIIISPAQANAAETALKGSLGEAIFSSQRPQVIQGEVQNKTGLDAVLAPTPTKESGGQGLIAAYQHDPAKFKLYAEMFDTAMNGKQVGRMVLQQPKPLRTPQQSTSLSFVESEIRLDAWGHPFCVFPVSNGVAVVSAGPKATEGGCAQPSFTQKRINPTERTIYQDSEGRIVVLVLPEERATTLP